MLLRSTTQYGCSFIRTASTVAFGILVTVMTSPAESMCREFDHERVFDRSDIVFAAEIKFSKHDFIKMNPDYDGYIRRYLYDYRALYVWKGDPGRSGVMHLGRGDTERIYNHPTLRDHEIEHIKKLSMRPPRLVLIYANKNDGNIVFGGCVDIPDYDYAFSQLLQLGIPSKTYSDNIFRLPDSKQIYSYIESVKSSSLEIDDYLVSKYLNNALDALLLLNEQESMIDYLSNDDFMRCRQSSNSISVMTGLIRRLPGYAQRIYDKFHFMLYCSEDSTRHSTFYALSQIVSSAVLARMIEQFMLDPSARLKKSAAESVSILSDEDKKIFLDRADEMLASDNSDHRLFVAVMLTHLDDIDLGLVKSVCEAQPASWQYHDDPRYSESVQDQCDSLTRTYKYALRKAGLLPNDRIQ